MVRSHMLVNGKAAIWLGISEFDDISIPKPRTFLTLINEHLNAPELLMQELTLKLYRLEMFCGRIRPEFQSFVEIADSIEESVAT